MFEDDGGLDVVRAMHLDLSGRPLHCGRRLEGERFLVGEPRHRGLVPTTVGSRNPLTFPMRPAV